MISMTNVRAILATVLIVSAALPQSSCSKYVNAEGKELSPLVPHADSSQYHRVKTYYYAFENVTLHEPGTLLIPIAFLWPFAAILVARRKPDARITRVLFWLEPVGLAGSANVIALNDLLMDAEVGWFVALCALALLFLTWLWMAIGRFRGWRARRAAPVAA
jgi:hypothetical protein